MGETERSVQQVSIEDAHAGQRIDNFLLARLKGVPRSRVYRLLRKGEIRVNSGRVRADYRLKAGDVVRMAPVRLAQRPAPPEGRGLEWLESRVLFEDDSLLVLDKPAGMAVHGGSGQSFGVIEALRALRPHMPMLELVHRLDRETSGCLMIAKKRSRLRALHGMFREGEIEKTYLALVEGRWHGGERRIDVALHKNVLRSGERVVRVSEEGKAAVSLFHPMERFATSSLVKVRLFTGRTHQIRVHARHLGHPLGGDEKYGSPTFNQAMRRLGLRRLFLHACGLRLRRAKDREPAVFRSALPIELEAVLKRLRQGGESR